MINYTTPFHVVTVDDDPITRLLVERYLKLSGFKGKFYAAANGQEALPVLADLDPENTVIVLDYNMPLMNGVELLKCMEARTWHHRVYMLTSSPLEAHRQECLGFENVVDYLIKPVDMARIQRILHTNGLVDITLAS